MTPALIATTSSSSGALTLLPLVLIAVVFYFLLIRPQQRRARAQRELVNELAAGDEVITVGGMFGTIRAVDDDSVSVELAPGTQIRMLKSAILRKTVEPEPYEDERPAGEEAGETS